MDTIYGLHSPFDIEKHKKTFVNYLEVIVFPDGHIEYAVPSHQEKLTEIACTKLNKSRKEIADMCPQEMYFDYTRYLCNITECISVWDMYVILPEQVTQMEQHTLQQLIDNGLLHLKEQDRINLHLI